MGLFDQERNQYLPLLVMHQRSCGCTSAWRRMTCPPNNVRQPGLYWGNSQSSLLKANLKLRKEIFLTDLRLSGRWLKIVLQ